MYRVTIKDKDGKLISQKEFVGVVESAIYIDNYRKENATISSKIEDIGNGTNSQRDDDN